MVEPKPNRIIRDNSPAWQAELKKLRQQLEAEKSALLAVDEVRITACPGLLRAWSDLNVADF